MQKVFLIDGHSQIFRMYYAFMRRPMVNSKGEEIERAPHPMMDVYVETDFYVPDESLVRRLV